MKRYIFLILILCLMLCACGNDKTDPATSTPSTQTQIPTETTLPATTPAPTTQAQTPTETTPPATQEQTPTETTPPATQEQTPTETTPPATQEQTPTETTPPDTTPAPTESEVVLAYRHPLNGTPIATPWSGQVTAVVINNLKKALPQAGISSADIFYEVENEGEITRCLAVFSDVSKVGVIGPVRSTRTYFNSLAASYDAPIIYCGGSVGLGLDGIYDSSMQAIPNWEHIDQSTYGKYFYRDMARYAAGYPWEHTGFTKGESLQQALKDMGYDTPETKTFGLVFDDNIALNGENANEVTIKFKEGKITTLKYDSAAGRYSLHQYDQDMVDSNSNQLVTFKNVIAIYTKQEFASNNMHKFYDTITSGNGYAAINGKIVPIKWSRTAVNAPFTYTLENGEPLTLDVGNTYVALVGIQHPISYK